jgi:hypothetical protein
MLVPVALEGGDNRPVTVLFRAGGSSRRDPPQASSSAIDQPRAGLTLKLNPINQAVEQRRDAQYCAEHNLPKSDRGCQSSRPNLAAFKDAGLAWLGLVIAPQTPVSSPVTDEK